LRVKTAEDKLVKDRKTKRQLAKVELERNADEEKRQL
jgi:hypothetical protein